MGLFSNIGRCFDWFLTGGVLFSSDIWLMFSYFYLLTFPGSDGKESACNAGDLSLIPGLGRYSGEGNGNLLQYSCLENFMDRGAWQAMVSGITKSQIWLCDPMDCTIPGILQARIQGWVAFPFSRSSSQPRDQTQVSCIAGGFFTS